MIQREGVRFIERGRTPRCGGVTSRAVCAKQAQMKNGIGMTGNARVGRSRKLVVDVTFLAFYLLMRARQREVTARMIEGRILPIGGRVTGGAIRAKFPRMNIICRVTSRAVLRGGL